MLRAARWFSGLALFGGDSHAFDQVFEAIEGVFFILLLGAVLLSFDDDDAIFGDAVVIESEQTFFVERR